MAREPSRAGSRAKVEPSSFRQRAAPSRAELDSFLALAEWSAAESGLIEP
jgi:hypothetical protein